MSQNLKAQIAFLTRWPPPVSKAETYRRPSPSSDMLGPLALRPAGGGKIANDGSARETLIKYPTPPILVSPPSGTHQPLLCPKVKVATAFEATGGEK